MSVAVASWSGERTKTAKKPPRWQFQGTYIVGDILADLCDRSGCSLGISGEVVNTPITLSVKTSSPTVLLEALRSALLGSGFYLSGSLRGKLSVYRDAGSLDNVAFVDRLNSVQVVPKSYAAAYRKADSLQAVADSLQQIKIETVSRRWRFEFYSVSETAAKSYGLDFEHPLMYGNLSITHPRNNTHLARSWNLDYLSENDSLFEQRSVSFDLDSVTVFSWGTQRQVVEKTFIQDGIQTTSYDWRQYGINITLSAYPKMRLEYTIRSPDESTITGTSALGADSSIFVVAHYDYNSNGERCFLPWLPIFCKPTQTNERRYLLIHVYRQPEELKHYPGKDSSGTE